MKKYKVFYVPMRRSAEFFSSTDDLGDALRIAKSISVVGKGYVRETCSNRLLAVYDREVRVDNGEQLAIAL